MSKKQRYLISIVLGLITGIFIVPIVLEWLGFSLAEFFNQTFGEPGMISWVIGAVVLVVLTYFVGRSFIRNYRSIEE